MTIERLDRIAFRFTHAELAALLMLMDLPALPAASVKPAIPTSGTVESLIESGIVMICGERILVDNTVALVLRNAAQSERCLVVQDAADRLILYRGQRMCVLTEESGQMLTLEPLQSVQTARDLWADAVKRMREPLYGCLMGKEGPTDERRGSEGLKKLYDQLEA